jgi:hypothetical protein
LIYVNRGEKLKNNQQDGPEEEAILPDHGDDAPSYTSGESLPGLIWIKPGDRECARLRHSSSRISGKDAPFIGAAPVDNLEEAV